MTKTLFFLGNSRKKSVLQPSLIPTDGELFTDKERLRKVQVRLIWSSKEAYLKSKRGSLKVGKSLTRWQPGTFRKLHRDVSGCTSGHNGYYIRDVFQMLHRDVISSLPWNAGNKVAIKKRLLPRVISL